MTISEQNRKYFEAISLPEIRRELVVGSAKYLGLENDHRRIEAREWVAEQDESNREAERIRTARETKVFNYTFWTLIAAIAAVLVGVIGVVVSLLQEPG